jgi:hypothetical protein
MLSGKRHTAGSERALPPHLIEVWLLSESIRTTTWLLHACATAVNQKHQYENTERACNDANNGDSLHVNSPFVIG